MSTPPGRSRARLVEERGELRVRDADVSIDMKVCRPCRPPFADFVTKSVTGNRRNVCPVAAPLVHGRWLGPAGAQRDETGNESAGSDAGGHDATADMSSSRAVRVMRQLRVPAGLKPRRMPLRHQSVTVRCGICRMAATCSGVRTSVGGFIPCDSMRIPQHSQEPICRFVTSVKNGVPDWTSVMR